MNAWLEEVLADVASSGEFTPFRHLSVLLWDSLELYAV